MTLYSKAAKILGLSVSVTAREYAKKATSSGRLFQQSESTTMGAIYVQGWKKESGNQRRIPHAFQDTICSISTEKQHSHLRNNTICSVRYSPVFF